MKEKSVILITFILINITCLGGKRILCDFETLHFKNIGTNEGFEFKDSLDGEIVFNINKGDWSIDHT